MTTIVIGAAKSSNSSPVATLFAAGAARVRQWVDCAQSTRASAGRRLHRAVNGRKEALERRLQGFVLELLAAIVLIAILIATDPAVRNDPDTGETGLRPNP